MKELSQTSRDSFGFDFGSKESWDDWLNFLKSGVLNFSNFFDYRIDRIDRTYRTVSVSIVFQISPNLQIFAKISDVRQNFKFSFKFEIFAQNLQKCFPAAAEPQDLCRHRRGGRAATAAAAARTAAAAAAVAAAPESEIYSI